MRIWLKVFLELREKKPLIYFGFFNCLMSSAAVLTSFSDEPCRIEASWSCWMNTWRCWDFIHWQTQTLLIALITGRIHNQLVVAGTTRKLNCFLSYFPFPVGNLQVNNVKYKQQLFLGVIQDSFPASAPNFQSITADNRLFVTADICIHKR